MSASIEPSSQKSSTHGAEDAAKEGSFNLSVVTIEEGCEVSVSFGFRTHMKSALRMLLTSWKRPKGIAILFMVAILTNHSDLLLI